MSELAEKLKVLLDEFEQGTALDESEYHRTLEIVPDPRPDAAKARREIEDLFRQHPIPVWVIEDDGGPTATFRLGYEGVVGDPMTYKVPREFMKRLCLSDIPELAKKNGWECWLG